MSRNPDPPQGSSAESDLSPEFFRSILERSPDLVTVADAEGRILYATPAATELVGYGPSERVGGSIFDLVHPDDADDHRAAFTELLARPDAVSDAEFRIRHKDGGVRVVHARGRNLLHDPAVAGVVTHLRDVTAQRATERERDAARELLESVIDHAPVILYVIDRDGVFDLSEGRGLEDLGLQPGEVVGLNVFEEFEGAEHSLTLIRRALDGEEVVGDTPVGDRIYHSVMTPVRGEDGEVEAVLGVSFDVTERERQARKAEFQARLLEAVGEAVIATDTEGTVVFWNRAAEEMYGWTAEEALGRNVTDLTVPEEEQESAGEILDDVRSRGRWTGDYLVRRKDGTIFPALVTDVALVENGEVVGIVGVSTSLRERRELEERLRQAQKMEAVGRLAGGIAHDFNNLLTAIGGYAGIAAEATEDEQVSADIAEVVNATERARVLVDKLLAFSRRSQTAPRPVDLNGVIVTMVGMLRRMIGDRIRLETDLADDLWPAYTDPVQIEQAIVNLAVNARDAMPEGGTITLRTDRVVLDGDRARKVSDQMEPGEYVRLTVSDTGTGMAPEVRERVFEPFFTTKGVGEGSGLGLSIVFGEVTRVGGGVAVGSTPGEGATFTVYLPAARGQAVYDRWTEPPAPPASPSDSESEVILLVEDEPAVRNLARRVLEREGYTVLEADSGVAAERLLEETGEPPSLLLTDVIMPEMGGAELAQRLKESHPHVPVLYMSGYTADELASRGVDETREDFLAKPFTPRQLRTAVRSTLSR